MFGLTRWNSFDDVFNFQREMDGVFNQFWNELPTRARLHHPSPSSSPSLQVTAIDDGWRVDIPLPGIDPKDVALEVAGNNLSIRADGPSEGKDTNAGTRYEQTLVIPQFLDLEKLTASHRHGMLRLTLPLKDSVKPRRVPRSRRRQRTTSSCWARGKKRQTFLTAASTGSNPELVEAVGGGNALHRDVPAFSMTSRNEQGPLPW